MFRQNSTSRRVRARPAAVDTGAPSALVLGRLLVVQQAIEALPGEVRISDFTRRALLAVPGVQDAYVHLHGHTVPPSPEMAVLLEKCEEEIRRAPALNFVRTLFCPGVHFFSIETPVEKFGILLVAVAEESLLEPYVGFLSNISNTISQVLETRLYESRLRHLNEDLRSARDDLELRVAERTRELEYRSTHDQLTGLANRTILFDRLQQAIANAHRQANMVTVVYLDLDSFRYINTGLGNQYGDIFLQEMARRLNGLVRDDDTVARVGSDEFVILLTGLENITRSSARLRAVSAAVRDPITLAGKNIVVTCSIGACFYPMDGGNAEILLRRANAAMHRAKSSGKDNIQFFAAGRDAPVAERIELETELRQAIPAGALLVHYQPKVEICTSKFVGAEALVRWMHPKKGLVPPSQFVPLAEESTLIVALGERVLMQACLQARIWQEAGVEGTAVSVNLAARQFRDGSIVETVGRVLRDTGLDPNRLEVEITESSIMHDLTHVSAIMHRLKELGVSISIDDFGTGYSSLSVLRYFPADKLKIDRSFVAEIETVPNAAAVTLAVISFAKSLRLRVIAEGVETVGQANFLKAHGCDEIQGYLVAPALPAEELQSMFAKPYLSAWTA